MSKWLQDYNATVTWTHDWTKHLNLNGITITAIVSVTCPHPGVSITNPTLDGTGKKVTFKMTTNPAQFTGSTTVVVTTRVTLSNANTDEQDIRFDVTDVGAA